MHLCVVFSSAFIGTCILPQLISIPAIESKPHSLPLRLAVSCHMVLSDPYSSAINSVLSSSQTTALNIVTALMFRHAFHTFKVPRFPVSRFPVPRYTVPRFQRPPVTNESTINGKTTIGNKNQNPQRTRWCPSLMLSSLL